MPIAIALQLLAERESLTQTAETNAERVAVDKQFGVRLDSYLDAGYGTCILRKYAAVVGDAIRHFDGVRYELHAWCVMPNHVHVLFHLAIGRDLNRILHSWKSYTAHRIGFGVIWQREYFDRVMRNDEEIVEKATYIRSNPSKRWPQLAVDAYRWVYVPGLRW